MLSWRRTPAHRGQVRGGGRVQMSNAAQEAAGISNYLFYDTYPISLFRQLSNNPLPASMIALFRHMMVRQVQVAASLRSRHSGLFDRLHHRFTIFHVCAPRM